MRMEERRPYHTGGRELTYTRRNGRTQGGSPDNAPSPSPMTETDTLGMSVLAGDSSRGQSQHQPQWDRVPDQHRPPLITGMLGQRAGIHRNQTPTTRGQARPVTRHGY